MRIKDGLNLTPGRNGMVEIPDCNRRDLPGFFKEMGYTKGVEIGVQRGYFLRPLLKSGLEVYGVDPWGTYDDYNVDDKFNNRQGAIYQAAVKNTQEFPKCKLIRKMSMDAVKDFEDESLDFVYIDGHHGFKYVTEDIFEWSKKVKKGGCISGHDYAYGRVKESHKNQPYILQVRYVIDAYTKAFNINPLYVLGNKRKEKEGEKRDQFRSWMWIKK